MTEPKLAFNKVTAGYLARQGGSALAGALAGSLLTGGTGGTVIGGLAGSAAGSIWGHHYLKHKSTQQLKSLKRKKNLSPQEKRDLTWLTTAEKDKHMKKEAFLIGFVKRAKEVGVTDANIAVMVKKLAEGPYDGYAGIGLQNYLPIQKRRDHLAPDEQQQIASEQDKIIPKIFWSQKDPIAARMSSPGWTAAGTGALGALIGGGAGGALTGSGAGGLIGALLGGTGAGLAGYFSRKARNEDLEENIRRLPHGAKIRDMQADPVYQKEQDRAVTRGTSGGLDTALLAAALMHR